MDLPTIIPIEYRGGLVALVSPRRIHIVAPWLLVRPAGDSELRFVALMCACAAEVLDGRIAAPFTSELGEAWARAALIELERLACVADLSDPQAAEALQVPVEQLRRARHERPRTMRTCVR